MIERMLQIARPAMICMLMSLDHRADCGRALSTAAECISTGIEVSTYSADVRDYDAVQKVVELAGEVDVLIVNAGVFILKELVKSSRRALASTSYFFIRCPNHSSIVRMPKILQNQLIVIRELAALRRMSLKNRKKKYTGLVSSTRSKLSIDFRSLSSFVPITTESKTTNEGCSRGLRVFFSRLRRSDVSQRCFSALPHYAYPRQDDQVLVNGRANSRMSVFDRPSILNALNTPMMARLQRLYEWWEENSNIGFVLMKGSEKAFCSGTDVISLYKWIEEGNTEDCGEFFDTLYKFVYLQATYLKPHVAILGGITIGSGAGISLPGMFRLATDKTVFAHPEVQIGFHPDAGASFYLSHLPGEYLALTGDKLNGVEMVAFGLATHYSLDARLSLMDERLSKLITDDPSVIETSLAQYGDVVFPDRSSILNRINMIDSCFSHDTVEEIVHALETEVSETRDNWCMKTLMKIREASPLSLKITLRSIREGRFQRLDQCLAREFQISLRAACGSVSKDFCEGVRARLVDKDFAPKWDPPSLAEVTKEMVDRYFLRAEETEPVLELPTA